MKNKKAFPIAIPVILLVVILGVAGFFVYRQFNTQKGQVQTPQNIQNEAANWQTYKNDTYGFNLNYPSDWLITNSGQEKGELHQFISPGTQLRMKENDLACSDGNNATECNADGVPADVILSISPKGILSITQSQGITQFNNATFTKYLGAFAGEQHFITTSGDNDFDFTCTNLSACTQMLSTFTFTNSTSAKAQCPALNVPQIKNLNYDAARVKIVTAGWKPSRVHSAISDFPSMTGNITIFWNKGYFELQDCAGTGLGQCLFTFQDPCNNYLHVTTAGEEGGSYHAKVQTFLIDQSR